MSEVIPEGWKVQSLDGNIEILSGFPFKSSLFSDDASRIGLIRIRDLETQTIKTFYDGDFDKSYVIRRGDILIGMDGDFNIVKWKAKNALLNQRICKVKASEGSHFFTDFLFHSLIDDLQKIHAETGATTVKHLSVKDIRAIEKAYPPLPEQQNIATILSSVDDVIEKTRAQINKLKDLKTGMMQALLTQGIGHTEFKDSPVGRIPKEWNVTFLNDWISINPRPSLKPPASTLVSFLKMEDVSNDSRVIKLRKQTLGEVSKGFTFFADGDVLFAKITPCMENGKGAFVSGLRNGIGFGSTEFHVLRARSHDEGRWIYHLTSSKQFRERAAGFMTGSAGQRRVPTEFLRNLEIAYPSSNEEVKEITRILDAADLRIMQVEEKHASIMRLKKALMQDLLTGKVRVKPDPTEVAAA